MYQTSSLTQFIPIYLVFLGYKNGLEEIKQQQFFKSIDFDVSVFSM